MSSYEFETHEPVDLYVEIGKGNGKTPLAAAGRLRKAQTGREAQT